jgi:hypothetical protein
MSQRTGFNTEVTGRQRTALFASLLIVAVAGGLSGCSTSKSQPVSSSSGKPTTQISPTPVRADLGTSNSSMPAEPPAHKKVAKPRSPMVTYSNSRYGLSFSYPWQYGFKPGHRLHSESDKEDVATKFIQPGGVNLATIELPKGYYPDTDLSYAFFTANVNKKMTAEECGQFASVQPAEQDQQKVADTSDKSAEESAVKSGDQPSTTPSKVTVSGIAFDAVEDLQDQSDEKYYHVFQNGVCYEFALGVISADDESVDGAKLVDHDKVFDRLEKLLATVDLGSDADPEVTASVPVAPAEGSKN